MFLGALDGNQECSRILFSTQSFRKILSYFHRLCGYHSVAFSHSLGVQLHTEIPAYIQRRRLMVVSRKPGLTTYTQHRLQPEPVWARNVITTGRY